ncbi:MAG: D-alanyl-D-alanine carboxypeptidase family protein [Eubacteriales bacterium]|nr:D-alanyl-D-alanine carboxypeptidase family protein [Eubacteriales bacterium]
MIFYRKNEEVEIGTDLQTVETVKYNSSSATIVVDQKSKKILSSSNAHVRLAMASTTKIMTAMVVLDNVVDVDVQLAIPQEAVGVEGSSVYLKRNEIWSVRDLLYALMLRSGNDAAVALSIAVGGSVQGFVDMMNAKASELGLKDTHFTNPHGLHDDNHYTTAYDLAIITAEAMKNPLLKSIVSAKSYVVEGNYTHDRYYLGNKNKMLLMMEGADGVKTGYTKNSGRCLVSSATRGDTQLICVVLNVHDMWNVSKNLLEKGFEQIKN